MTVSDLPRSRQQGSEKLSALRRLRRFAKQNCPAPLWVGTRTIYGLTLVGIARTIGFLQVLHYWALQARLKLRTLVYGIDHRRPVKTLEEVDRVFARAEKAGAVSNEALRAVLDDIRFDPGIILPSDPYSPEYRQAQMDLYARISGRPTYSPDTSEVVEVDVNALAANPYPYWTRSSSLVGEQLMGIGFTIRSMKLRPGDRILEFGAGSGTSTLEFAKLGHPVTAVDINPGYIEVIRARSRQLGLSVDLACAEMLDYQPDEPFDRVVFYECFHHCADHLKMIERFELLVRPGGAVIFAGEPIHSWLRWPWGLRMDGQAIWAIRLHGWLELGFRTDYFVRTLARYGWTVTEMDSRDVPWLHVFVARRTSETGS